MGRATRRRPARPTRRSRRTSSPTTCGTATTTTHDGNFNEPDGYLDHFQIVHAGGDQADGDPYQGEDAIWSHRSKAFTNLDGTAGPEFNKDGGVQIGTTGLWVADYTMQPENGGVSVFAHEYAHDLGLPDEYDTTAATGTQENAVNWWSLMAQSRQSGAGEAVGTRAADLGAWDKLQLGWLDYEVVPAGNDPRARPRPAEYNSAKAQGVVVPLPKKRVTTQLGAPHGGTKQWWSDQGDERESTLTRQVDAARRAARRCPSGRAGTSRTAAPTRVTTRTSRSTTGPASRPIPGSIANAAEGNGIDGYQPAWTQATFDLSAFAGKTVSLRLRYTTDPAVQGAAGPRRDEPAGIFADDFTLTAGGQTVFTDGAESGNNGWTPDGFVAVGASRSIDYDNYYVASNRQYVSYDQYLKTGPYNYLTPALPNFAEHFPYQDGLIVSYWDTLVLGQRRERAPGRGRDPGGRREPAADLPPGRPAVARPDPDVRRAVLAREVGLVHAPHAETGSRATSAARTPCRCSTTAGPTGTRRCRTSA